MIGRLCVVVLLSLAGINARASGPGDDKLCDVLGRIAAGEQIPVTFTGIYVVSYEHQLFYDPSTPNCAIDVQPVTWLEFSPNFKEDRRFDEHLRSDRRVWGTFTGVLWGPGEVKPDDLSAPMMIAYANRIANRRYGHMNAFRTRFVVESVRDVRPVPKDAASYGTWARLRTKSDIPRLVDGQLPQYPPAAQNVGIAGPVVIEITVTAGAVQATNVKVGDRILVDAVLATVATWRFDPSVNTKFTSTFLFELRRTPTGADTNVELDLQLPTFARLSAPMNGR
jgi:TonB family protein